MVTRGIALADVAGDGRLEFAVANQWEPSFLFRNTAPSPRLPGPAHAAVGRPPDQ
jgi:hypothetical protein